MRSSRRLFVNAVSSLVQLAFSGAALFVLYRYLYDTLGEADFGVWAVVLGTTYLGVIADLGVSASSVKFVAKYLARDEPFQAARVMETIIISSAVLLGGITVLLYFALPPVLSLIIRPLSELPDALAILPYALASLWFNTLTGAIRSCLDGMHRIVVRNVLMVASTLLYLVLVLVLVPRRGLVGLAEAQLVQAVILMLAGWFTLRHLLPLLPLIPHRWHHQTFKEIIGYSLNFQAIGVARMLCEPVTKGLLSRLGGVELVAYYEMAYKLAFYLRNLIAAAHEAILPHLADLYERAPSALPRIYRTSFHLLLLLLAVGLPLLLTLTPAISRLWLGAPVPAFITFTMLLLGGWFLNLLANPAYFAYLGIGTLRWNVAGHWLTAVLNLLAGLGLGLMIGPAGVVAGFALANVLGSFLIAVAYQQEYHIRLGDLIQHDTLGLLGGATLGAAAVTLLYGWLRFQWPLLALIPLMLVVYAASVALPLHRHTAWRALLSWLSRLRPSASTPSNEPSS